jgi:phosphoglycolate phosphatase-like HAD superfamily hydrolase
VWRQIQLLIFDLDYLIFDCAALKGKALSESLISFADEIAHDMRLPDDADAEEGFRDHGCRWPRSLRIGLDEANLQQLLYAYRIHEERLATAGAGKIYPGVPELLVRCRKNGASLALGAEASRDYLLAVSDRHGLDDHFEWAFCTEEFGMGSAAEMFAEIMGRAEVNPSETLMLGTRPGFFEAARAVDVLSIGCGWGIHKHEPLGAADLRSLSLSTIYHTIEKADALAARDLA